MNKMSEKKEKSSYANIFKKCATTEGIGSEDFEKCCDNEIKKDSTNPLNTAENIIKAIINKSTDEGKSGSSTNT